MNLFSRVCLLNCLCIVLSIQNMIIQQNTLTTISKWKYITTYYFREMSRPSLSSHNKQIKSVTAFDEGVLSNQQRKPHPS